MSSDARLMLLDTASLYFRAFYGVPDTVRAEDGTPVNAVRGLLDMITKLITFAPPIAVVACWDDDWRPQWRVDLIPSYKQHRVMQEVADGPDVEETPDPLLVQLPIIRDMLGAIGVPIVGAPDAEADDVIGTLAQLATGPVDVVTGDRDLFQLIDDARGVRVISTTRGMSNLELLDEAAVAEKYGVRAEQYADFATLRGDASDGLPGVKGIGEKTAATLLQAHGDLAGIQAAAQAGVLSAGVRAKLEAAQDYLAVAPEVVRVARDLPLTLPTAGLSPLDPAAARSARELAERWSYASSLTRFEQAVSTLVQR